jgi:hypothetical protein
MAGTEVFLITYLLQLIRFIAWIKYPVLSTCFSQAIYGREKGEGERERNINV